MLMSQNLSWPKNKRQMSRCPPLRATINQIIKILYLALTEILVRDSNTVRGNVF